MATESLAATLEELVATLADVLSNTAAPPGIQSRTWTTNLVQFEDGQAADISTETLERCRDLHAYELHAEKVDDRRADLQD